MEQAFDTVGNALHSGAGKSQAQFYHLPEYFQYGVFRGPYN